MCARTVAMPLTSVHNAALMQVAQARNHIPHKYHDHSLGDSS
jgi:hypothetical protein